MVAVSIFNGLGNKEKLRIVAAAVLFLKNIELFALDLIIRSSLFLINS